ncbi:MAG: hypothetical protein ACFFCS_25135 [Candidatus Hodarchaeota archaeon]
MWKSIEVIGPDNSGKVLKMRKPSDYENVRVFIITRALLLVSAIIFICLLPVFIEIDPTYIMVVIAIMVSSTGLFLWYMMFMIDIEQILEVNKESKMIFAIKVIGGIFKRHTTRPIKELEYISLYSKTYQSKNSFGSKTYYGIRLLFSDGKKLITLKNAKPSFADTISEELLVLIQKLEDFIKS